MNFEVRPGHGPDFAEQAEVLGITTRDIVSVLDEGGKQVVLYTKTTETDAVKSPPVYIARMHRGVIDGVLVLDGEPELFAGPSFWEDMHGIVSERLRKRFGPPDDEHAQ